MTGVHSSSLSGHMPEPRAGCKIQAWNSSHQQRAQGLQGHGGYWRGLVRVCLLARVLSGGGQGASEESGATRGQSSCFSALSKGRATNTSVHPAMNCFGYLFYQKEYVFIPATTPGNSPKIPQTVGRDEQMIDVLEYSKDVVKNGRELWVASG